MACIELYHYLQKFFLTYDQWSDVYKRFARELAKVHSKTEWSKSTLKCIPISIYKIPGEENFVKSLGISLGAELRCFLLMIQGEPQNIKVFHARYNIPENLQLTAEDDFFDFIIECLCQFAQKHNVDKHFLPLGVTYDIPKYHTGERDMEKTVTRLAKAFQFVGPERDDVNLLLTVALTKNLDLETCKFVLVNKTSALLMFAIGLVNPKCRFVVTEHGAAYIDSVENFHVLGEQKRKDKHTIMELDWSEFADSNILDDILSEFDVQDSKVHVLENMIAGRNRCETFRIILLRLVKDDVVFHFHTDRLEFIKKMSKDGCFRIEDLELIEEDEFPEFMHTKAFVKKAFGMDSISLEDCFKLRYICQSLGKRAAIMVAIIISSWINRQNENYVVIGLDKRLFRLKERYTLITDFLFMLVHPLLHYEIICIEEDVGVAAALTAGMSINYQKIFNQAYSYEEIL